MLVNQLELPSATEFLCCSQHQALILIGSGQQVIQLDGSQADYTNNEKNADQRNPRRGVACRDR